MRHFRVRVRRGREHVWVKLNRFSKVGKPSPKMLWRIAARKEAMALYFSVVRFLMPERVSDIRSLRKAYPLGGPFFLDIDAWMVPTGDGLRRLRSGEVLLATVEYALRRALHALDLIYENHSRVRVVFSGWKGFHIYVLDFDERDWSRSEDPVYRLRDARRRYLSVLEAMGLRISPAHRVVSTDPTRIAALPWSLKAESGLVCADLGEGFGLDFLRPVDVLEMANPWRFLNYELRDAGDAFSARVKRKLAHSARPRPGRG